MSQSDIRSMWHKTRCTSSTQVTFVMITWWWIVSNLCNGIHNHVDDKLASERQDTCHRPNPGGTVDEHKSIARYKPISIEHLENHKNYLNNLIHNQHYRSWRHQIELTMRLEHLCNDLMRSSSIRFISYFCLLRPPPNS